VYVGHFVTMQMQLKLHTLIVGELSYFWPLRSQVSCSGQLIQWLARL